MTFIFHRGNAQIEAGPESLRIVVPYWLGWFPFLFLAVWTFATVGWTGGSTGTEVFLERAFSALGVGMIIWLIFGAETVTLQAQSMTVWRGIFGIGPSYNFGLADVKGVRVGSFLDPNARGKWDASYVRASVCFEYRGKPTFFGHEIQGSEAAHIVRVIPQYYPQIVYKSSETPDEKFRGELSKSHPALRPNTGAGLKPIVLLLWGLFMIWGFGVDTVGVRLKMQVDGVVVSRRDISSERGATEYTVRGAYSLDHILTWTG